MFVIVTLLHSYRNVIIAETISHQISLSEVIAQSQYMLPIVYCNILKLAPGVSLGYIYKMTNCLFLNCGWQFLTTYFMQDEVEPQLERLREYRRISALMRKADGGSMTGSRRAAWLTANTGTAHLAGTSDRDKALFVSHAPHLTFTPPAVHLHSTCFLLAFCTSAALKVK